MMCLRTTRAWILIFAFLTRCEGDIGNLSGLAPQAKAPAPPVPGKMPASTPANAPCPDEAGECVWPNAASSANSDPWISAHHDEITVMRPRFLVINFANHGGAASEYLPTPTEALERSVTRFLKLLRQASRFQPHLDATRRPFIEPRLEKIVNLSDASRKPNSALFPRGPIVPATPGYQRVGYHKLFSQAYAQYWGYQESGRYLTLGELVNRGTIHDVIMVAHQIDELPTNEPAQVTSGILEVAYVFQSYDNQFKALAGEYVRNGTTRLRQKADMTMTIPDDQNSMLWSGRSLRILFMNATDSNGGNLLHSLGHYIETRSEHAKNYSPSSPYHFQSPLPWLHPLFLRYAGYDMVTRYGLPFDSFYRDVALYGDNMVYTDCAQACATMTRGAHTASSYTVGCGNVHYAPGSAHAYHYDTTSPVYSFCETFQQPGEQVSPVSGQAWLANPAQSLFETDFGEPLSAETKYLLYWYQNMPNAKSVARDNQNKPMKNWWPFLYY